MFDRYYCIKTENICYISCFLHYFVLPFHRCLKNAISTDYARYMARQYISHNGSKSVAPVRSYGQLRSLLIHGISPVNARLLITCYTAFYAIICFTWMVLDYQCLWSGPFVVFLCSGFRFESDALLCFIIVVFIT